MLRIGLVTYLMLSIAAGPWFCCCTAVRLLSSFAPSVAQASPRKCCCQRNASDTRQPAAKAHEKSPCHCQEKSPPVLAPSESKPVHSLAGADTAPAAMEQVFCRPAGEMREQSPMPFVTANDLLRCLHILRC